MDFTFSIATLISFSWIIVVSMSPAVPPRNWFKPRIDSMIPSPRGLRHHNIRPVPCSGRRSGESETITGICMFAWDCMKLNGTHLGTCIDRFYFGSCCEIPIQDGPLQLPSESIMSSNAIPPSPNRIKTSTTVLVQVATSPSPPRLPSTTLSSSSSSTTLLWIPEPESSTFSEDNVKVSPKPPVFPVKPPSFYPEKTTTATSIPSTSTSVPSTTARPYLPFYDLPTTTSPPSTTTALLTTNVPSTRATITPVIRTTTLPTTTSTTTPLPTTEATTTPRPTTPSTTTPRPTTASTTTPRPTTASTTTPRPTTTSTTTSRPTTTSTTTPRPTTTSTKTVATTTTESTTTSTTTTPRTTTTTTTTPITTSSTTTVTPPTTTISSTTTTELTTTAEIEATTASKIDQVLHFLNNYNNFTGAADCLVLVNCGLDLLQAAAGCPGRLDEFFSSNHVTLRSSSLVVVDVERC